MPKEIPLPGVGKKGITVMGHHVSNDALLMTAGGIIAAVVLYRIGKPSAGVNPNASGDQFLGAQAQQPASVEGTTAGSSLLGSGTPGPADPPVGFFGMPISPRTPSGSQSVMTGGGGAAIAVIGHPAPTPQGPSPASHPKYIGEGPIYGPPLAPGGIIQAGALAGVTQQGPSPSSHPKGIGTGGGGSDSTEGAGSLQSLINGATSLATLVTQQQQATIQKAQGPSPKSHPKNHTTGGPPPKSVNQGLLPTPGVSGGGRGIGGHGAQ